MQQFKHYCDIQFPGVSQYTIIILEFMMNFLIYYTDQCKYTFRKS